MRLSQKSSATKDSRSSFGMRSSRHGHWHFNYDNAWDPDFANNRSLKQDQIFLRGTEGLGFEFDRVRTFFGFDTSAKPLSRFRQAEEYCQRITLNKLENGQGDTGVYRNAKLDDWSRSGQGSTGCARPYENPLTAAALYKHLNARVS